MNEFSRLSMISCSISSRLYPTRKKRDSFYFVGLLFIFNNFVLLKLEMSYENFKQARIFKQSPRISDKFSSISYPDKNMITLEPSTCFYRIVLEVC